MHSTVLVIVNLSVCLSVCHTRGLCPRGSTYDHDFFTYGSHSSFLAPNFLSTFQLPNSRSDTSGVGKNVVFSKSGSMRDKLYINQILVNIRRSYISLTFSEASLYSPLSSCCKFLGRVLQERVCQKLLKIDTRRRCVANLAIIKCETFWNTRVQSGRSFCLERFPWPSQRQHINSLCLLLDDSSNISTSHSTSTPRAFEFFLQQRAI